MFLLTLPPSLGCIIISLLSFPFSPPPPPPRGGGPIQSNLAAEMMRPKPTE
ncbi:unnamed protein product [Penicillium nalgiovense]|nr:unnamed protein product [Penicillium nalgiovense]